MVIGVRPSAARRRSWRRVLAAAVVTVAAGVGSAAPAAASSPAGCAGDGACAAACAAPAAAPGEVVDTSSAYPSPAGTLVRRGRVGRRTSPSRRSAIVRRPRVTEVPCPVPVIPEAPVAVLLALSGAVVLAVGATRQRRRATGAIDAR